jgi:hypothetical protein
MTFKLAPFVTKNENLYLFYREKRCISVSKDASAGQTLRYPFDTDSASSMSSWS